MVIMEDLNDFLDYQPEMKIASEEDEKHIIEGIYNLSSSYKDTYLYGRYAIKIEVPKIYPEILPQVFDIDNIIPKEFEHLYSDGSLCLGSPMELYLSALEHKISEFLIKHIDSYLYSVTYFIKYNCQFPYGERSHGLMGILEFWKEYLNTDDYGVIYDVMDYISKGKYRGHNSCPCRSNEKIRNCHGNKILPVIKSSLYGLVEEEKNLFKKEVKRIIEQQKTTPRQQI